MANTNFDIIIVGGGPIGAATAYFLTRQPGLKIAVIHRDSVEFDTYKSAGGSIRWFWDDPLKVQMTSETAGFVKDLIRQGVDLAHLEDSYLFLNRGAFVPSLNVSGGKLVGYFMDQAKAAGAEVLVSEVTGISKEAGGHRVTLGDRELTAKQVLVATGPGISTLVPGYEQELEKRQLFVLDLPVDESRRNFPHTIVKIGDGVAYAFIKDMRGSLKMLVGQEGLVEDAQAGPNDYFQELLEVGLADRMPFLQGAKTEKILMGRDPEHKNLKIHEDDGLWAASCGSAVRGCVYIGRVLAERLTEKQ